jgi:hypothetical protein
LAHDGAALHAPGPYIASGRVQLGDPTANLGATVDQLQPLVIDRQWVRAVRPAH